MPTYSHMAVVLRDIMLLSCITAAAAQDEWAQLKQQIRYPTAMRKAMEDCACTGSPKSWQHRRSKLKDTKRQGPKHDHDMQKRDLLAGLCAVWLCTVASTHVCRPYELNLTVQ
jgi:hypothetical protein